MKHILKKIFIVLGCVIPSFFINAQTLKFGHINSAELVQLMPGVKDADAKLQAYYKLLEDQLKNMNTEYQTKAQEYQSKQALMADPIKEVKEKELADLEQRIVSFQQSAQEKVASKKEELYNPILKKAETAIKDVAKENGYSYVFDTSMGAVLFAQDSDNIMSLVKKKLGLQ